MLEGVPYQPGIQEKIDKVKTLLEKHVKNGDIIDFGLSTCIGQNNRGALQGFRSNNDKLQRITHFKEGMIVKVNQPRPKSHDNYFSPYFVDNQLVTPKPGHVADFTANRNTATFGAYLGLDVHSFPARSGNFIAATIKFKPGFDYEKNQEFFTTIQDLMDTVQPHSTMEVPDVLKAHYTGGQMPAKYAIAPHALAPLEAFKPTADHFQQKGTIITQDMIDGYVHSYRENRDFIHKEAGAEYLAQLDAEIAQHHKEVMAEIEKAKPPISPLKPVPKKLPELGNPEEVLKPDAKAVGEGTHPTDNALSDTAHGAPLNAIENAGAKSERAWYQSLTHTKAGEFSGKRTAVSAAILAAVVGLGYMATRNPKKEQTWGNRVASEPASLQL